MVAKIVVLNIFHMEGGWVSWGRLLKTPPNRNIRFQRMNPLHNKWGWDFFLLFVYKALTYIIVVTILVIIYIKKDMRISQ